jgi:hypothetical protein
METKTGRERKNEFFESVTSKFNRKLNSFFDCGIACLPSLEILLSDPHYCSPTKDN